MIPHKIVIFDYIFSGVNNKYTNKTGRYVVTSDDVVVALKRDAYANGGIIDTRDFITFDDVVVT